MPLARIDLVEGRRTPEQLICGDTGLGLERTDDLVVLQVFQQGRSEEQKAPYAELAAGLQERCGLDPQDLVVSVVTTTAADWSFGRGRAQFVEGDL